MIIKNILSQEEIDSIQNIVVRCRKVDKQETYGRYMYHDFSGQQPDEIAFIETISNKVVEVTNKPYRLYGFTVADYTAEAGEPNLPPHYDGDQTDLIMTYQISSNRTWGVGVDLNVYELEDNDGIIFHPNESIHWRPHAKFEDGELVRVMFIRFRLPTESDYSHLTLSQHDPIFDEVRAYRDSL
jgi:hypothetical protein